MDIKINREINYSMVVTEDELKALISFLSSIAVFIIMRLYNHSA